ncbi:MAG: multicopper oxidase domain-containing protein [Mycobacteriales bacterium]
MALTRDQARQTTRLDGERSRAGGWEINDQMWMNVVASGFTDLVAHPELGEVQLWEIQNRRDDWFHPVHIHLVDFQVLSRNGSAPFAWERGPKDTVYVGPEETVQVLMRFATGEGSSGGRYMVHCHNLVHEDHDMMVQYQVGDADPAADPNDPMTAAPPGIDDLPADQPSYETPVAANGW